ncbi:MAG: hypothetical protein RBR82_10260 [Pseudomonas sp.]|nr:hypothetical protein [Pseudomonas sp.]
MRKVIGFFIIALAIAITTGCATNRGIVDIPYESSMNPDEGQVVKFIRITDKRDFQLKPSQANIPSLKNGEINDSAITERAIARKRNTYGKALGDILLPEGKTVMDVVESRLSAGFRDNGYKVLSRGDDGYNEALPIEVDIKDFWGWFSPGFWSIGINFKSSIIVTAPLNEFSRGVEFNSEVQERFQAASGSNWQKVINRSLAELNNDIRAGIQRIEMSNKAR